MKDLTHKYLDATGRESAIIHSGIAMFSPEEFLVLLTKIWITVDPTTDKKILEEILENKFSRTRCDFCKKEVLDQF